MKPKTPRLVRPADRVTDNRQHWRLKVATIKRNNFTNLVEPTSDARFVR